MGAPPELDGAAMKGDGVCSGTENPWTAPSDCAQLKIHEGGTAALSGDGSRIALSHENQLLLYDMSTEEPNVPMRVVDDVRFVIDMSADGHWVVVSGLLDAADTNNADDIYLVSFADDEIRRVSANPDGTQSVFHADSHGLSPDDSQVHFLLYVPDSQGIDRAEHYSYDIATGERAPTDDQAFGKTWDAAGRLEVFWDLDPLLSDDTNNVHDVYLRDAVDGTLERVSVNREGIEGNGDSQWASISEDGQLVMFYSHASNLTSGGAEGPAFFVHDRRSGGNMRLASMSDSGPSMLSANGRFAAITDRYNIYLVSLASWLGLRPDE